MDALVHRTEERAMTLFPKPLVLRQDAFFSWTVIVAVVALLAFNILVHAGCPLPHICTKAPKRLNSESRTDGQDDDSEVCVATDGNGIWLAAWIAVDVHGPDADILFSRSSDDGQTWSESMPLNSNADTDIGSDNAPRLTTDGRGIWIAVWSSEDSLSGTIGTDADILFSRSTDGGLTWSPPNALNTNASVDDRADFSPIVATNFESTWIAGWDSDDELGGTIGADRDILFSRSTDGGQTWSAPAPMNTNAGVDSGEDRRVHFCGSIDGAWVANWMSTDSLGDTIGTDTDILFARSVDDGMTWMFPAPMNAAAIDGSSRDEEPHLTTDRNGNWMAVWTWRAGGSPGAAEFDILSSTSFDDGQTWSTPVQVNANGSFDVDDDLAPHVATDGLGHWIVAWETDDPFQGALGDDLDIVMAHTADFGATWSHEIRGNRNASDDGIINDFAPDLASDQDGTWILVWTTWNTFDVGIGWDTDIAVAAIELISPEDCNMNGVADSCDLAAGTLMDDDYDGLPDLCESVPLPQGHRITLALTGNESPTGGTHAIFYGPQLNDVPKTVVSIAPSAGAPHAIVRFDGKDPEIVVESDRQAPGTPVGTFFQHTFTEFWLNTLTDVAFASDVWGRDINTSNDLGIWLSSNGTTSLVAREGSQAAGTPNGVTFFAFAAQSSIPQVRVGETGTITFAARMIGPGVDSTNDRGIWTWNNDSQQLVARSSQPAVGMMGVYKFFWNPSIDSQGRILFPAQVASVTLTPDAYWFGSPFAITPIVLKGQQAPGMREGVVFSSIDERPLLNSLGDIVFNAVLAGPGISNTNNESIWRWSNGSLTNIVQEDDIAPDLPAGTTLGSLRLRSMNRAGRIAFSSQLRGPGIVSSNSSALWVQSLNGIRMVARSGDQGPDSVPSWVFFSLNGTGTLPIVAMNNADGVVFSATLDGTNLHVGVWGWTPTHGLFSIAPPGVEFAVDGEVLGTVDDAFIFGLDGTSHSISLTEAGEYAFRVNFASATPSQGVFLGHLPVFCDLNADGIVNIDDLLSIIASWGACPDRDDCFAYEAGCVADVDGNAQVNVNDLLLVINNWG
jgi:hypothetical protein